MDTAKKRKRCQNTSTQQYEEYLKLMETDDIFRTNKLTPIVPPDYIDKTWVTLSNKLNSSDTGPVLSPKEWVKRFNDWKNSTRAKYRKIIESRIKTGGGAGDEIKLTSLEERGLSVWGKVVVTGSPKVPVVAGLQHFQNQLVSPAPKSSCGNSDHDEPVSLEEEIKETTAIFEEETQNDKIEFEIEGSIEKTSEAPKPSKLKSLHKILRKRKLEDRSVKTIGEELLKEYKEHTVSNKEELKLKEYQLKLEAEKFRFEVTKYKFENPSFSFDINFSF